MFCCLYFYDIIHKSIITGLGFIELEGRQLRLYKDSEGISARTTSKENIREKTARQMN